MKWLLIAGAVLGSLIVLIAIVGALLPKAHTAAGARDYPGQAAAQLFAKVEALVANDTEVPVDIVERVAPSRLVTRIKPGQPFGGSWTIEVTDGRVAITEHGEVYNPIFRFMAKYVFGHTATLEATLNKLAG